MQAVVIVFGVAVAIQIIYEIIFLTAFNRKRAVPAAGQLPVSVVVCAHDEENNLRELIPQLLAQDYAEFEVIIVNDRSNDETYDLLLAETKKDTRLRMVHVDHLPPHVNSKKYGLTLGIKAAKYEWVLFTDADCRPQSPRWIASMSAYFGEQTGFVLGYSPYRPAPGWLNAFIRFDSLLTAIQYFAYALKGNPYMGVGRNLAYRKSAFLDNKGFNQFSNLTGGDDDLYVNQHAQGANTAVCLEHEASMLSIPKTSWSAFYHQKVRHLSVGKYYKFKHRFQLGLFMISWMLVWFMLFPLVALTAGDVLYGILAAAAVRIILVTVTTQVAVKKLGQPFEAWRVPVLDFVFPFYYLTTGLVAWMSKKVRWKKN